MRKGQALANGRALAAIRDLRGLSQPGLAERTRILAGLANPVDDDPPVPVSESMIAMIESGRRHPGADVLRTLALVLEVEEAALARVLPDDEHRCPVCLGSGTRPSEPVGRVA